MSEEYVCLVNHGKAPCLCDLKPISPGIGDLIEKKNKKIEELESLCARYRGALEKIANLTPPFHTGEKVWSLNSEGSHQKIAREALHPDQQGGGSGL